MRPGNQQVREYYQLKREHERLRKVVQQSSQLDLNSSTKSLTNLAGNTYIIGTHPAFKKHQKSGKKDEAAIVRETATFEKRNI